MVLDWFLNYGGVIAFYVFIVILVYINRKKFEFEGKIIALYKTSLGIKYMKIFANKYPRTLMFLGTFGIYVGFLGMFLMLGMIGFGIYQLISMPDMPPLFQPVLPGFELPGGLKIPLLQGLLALFVVVVVHEFAHGVISKLYSIRIKSSGFAMIGPIPAAFVEPDEKKLDKAPYKHQMSMFAAGPFSNVLLAIFITFLVILAGFGSNALFEPSGVELLEFNESDARFENVEEGMVIKSVEGQTIKTPIDLTNSLDSYSPGDNVLVEFNGLNKSIELLSHPQDENWAYLGVVVDPVVSAKNPALDFLRPVYFWLFGNIHSAADVPVLTLIMFKLFGGFGFASFGLLDWIFHLSIGIGLVNLLPIGPVDGGRMFLLTLQRYFKDATAKKIWGGVSYVLLVLVIILIFFPLLRGFF